jgi:hypothetical protein
MDHHVKKPAVVERLTNQLNNRDVFVNMLTVSLTRKKKRKEGALENFGCTG